MNLAYPIKAILMYLAIYFAPPDVNRITVENSSDSPRIELVRNGQTWESDGNAITIDGETLVVHGSNVRESLKISDFVALPGDHDWSKNPTFTLGDATTLEKTDTGFTCRRSSGKGEGNGVYQIRHDKPAAGTGITVNVLGEVVKPGAYGISSTGSVLDALAAAGGSATRADMKQVSIIRGPAGTVPKVTIHDLTAILEGKGSNPVIEAGDTVFVPAVSEGDPKSPGGPEIGVRAEQWLVGIDAGKYGQSWKDAAAFFQTAITENGWIAALQGVRKPLGAVKSRKILDLKKADALPGAPDGQYVVIQFDTSFAAKENAVETVTFMLERDGSWKASGYFIR
jgi:hypothetical protein